MLQHIRIRGMAPFQRNRLPLLCLGRWRLGHRVHLCLPRQLQISLLVAEPFDPCIQAHAVAVRAAQIDVASTYNFTPYVVASLLFILMSVPFILLNDWYTERLRKRELSGGTV